jgi:hypothetical protein
MLQRLQYARLFQSLTNLMGELWTFAVLLQTNNTSIFILRYATNIKTKTVRCAQKVYWRQQYWFVWPEREAGYWFPWKAKIKNEWNYASTSQYTFMACTWTPLLLSLLVCVITYPPLYLYKPGSNGQTVSSINTHTGVFVIPLGFALHFVDAGFFYCCFFYIIVTFNFLYNSLLFFSFFPGWALLYARTDATTDQFKLWHHLDILFQPHITNSAGDSGNFNTLDANWRWNHPQTASLY